MKAKSTIQKEIRKLRKMSGDIAASISQRRCAYETASALEWSLYGKCDWTPSGLIRRFR